MSKSCFTCKVHTVLDCCSNCQAVQYCSNSCQKADWKQHKEICQFLNVGDGAMQVRTDKHVDGYAKLEETFQGAERSFDEDDKRFFKLFTESTHEESLAAAQEMKKIAARHTKLNQKAILFHSLNLLMRTDSKELRWPNSPLRIMLQFVDTNARWANAEEEDSREEMVRGPTPLHQLSCQADPQGRSFHKNQVILGQQLFRHGANANLRIEGLTPLHLACHSDAVTNLDFIQLLLEKGASPNVRDNQGMTPLMSAVPMAPGTAKFLLEWSTPPTTDIHITNRAGLTLFDLVHSTIENFSAQAELHDNAERVKRAFLLEQWREIEQMLVERGSH
jgi:hypothetical protein